MVPDGNGMPPGREKAGAGFQNSLFGNRSVCLFYMFSVFRNRDPSVGRRKGVTDVVRSTYMRYAVCPQFGSEGALLDNDAFAAPLGITAIAPPRRTSSAMGEDFSHVILAQRAEGMDKTLLAWRLRYKVSLATASKDGQTLLPKNGIEQI